MKKILILICFVMFINPSFVYAKDLILHGEKGAQITLIDNGSVPYQTYSAVKYKSPTGKEFILAKTYDKNSGFDWMEELAISKNLRYIILNAMAFYKVIDGKKTGFETKGLCPIIDFRTGCMIYMGTRFECVGKWNGNSTWENDRPGEIDTSKYKGPRVKAVWLDFIDGFNSNEEGKYIKKHIDKELDSSIDNYDFNYYLDDDLGVNNVQNTLVCDNINSDNLAYYKLIEHQLKNDKIKGYKLIQKAIKESAITSDKVSKQIVSKKAPLYNTPRNKDKSSAYLVAGDSVVIVDESKIKRGWYEISYISKSGKILNKWIHAADIAGNSNIKTLADEPEVKKQEEAFGGNKMLFSCRYAMIDSIDHKPITFTRYKIKRADGSIEKGVTDKHGYTSPIKMGKEGKKEYIYLKLDI